MQILYKNKNGNVMPASVRSIYPLTENTDKIADTGTNDNGAFGSVPGIQIHEIFDALNTPSRYGTLINMTGNYAGSHYMASQMFFGGHGTGSIESLPLPVYIRSHTDSDDNYGWTKWRRLVYYDEIESSMYPVGFSFISSKNLDMKSLVGGTWTITAYNQTTPKLYEYTRTA